MRARDASGFERSENFVGQFPPPGRSLRLSLRCIVFEDQLGNMVLVDPARARPMGLDQRATRPPTVYVAATDAELTTALEQMLYHFERATSVDRRHRSLIERVREAIDRSQGRRRDVHRAA